MGILKISLRDLPTSQIIGKNRLAHRILWGRFGIKLLFGVQFRTFLVDFFQSQN